MKDNRTYIILSEMLGTLSPEGPGPSPEFKLPSIERGLLALRSRKEGGKLEGVAVGTKFWSPALSSAPDMEDISWSRVSCDRRSEEAEAGTPWSAISSLISITSGTGCSVLTGMESSGGSAIG